MALHVLVADDDGISAELVRSVLQVRGFDVAVASSGRETLEAIGRRRPDLIVLDVVMPDVSGMAILDQIRATPTLANIPVIMVTAKADDEDLLAGYRFGADYYITKPCSARALLYGVALVLGLEIPEAAAERDRS